MKPHETATTSNTFFLDLESTWIQVRKRLRQANAHPKVWCISLLHSYRPHRNQSPLPSLVCEDLSPAAKAKRRRRQHAVVDPYMDARQVITMNLMASFCLMFPKCFVIVSFSSLVRVGNCHNPHTSLRLLHEQRWLALSSRSNGEKITCLSECAFQPLKI